MVVPKARQIATDKPLTAVKCGKQTQPSSHSTIAGSKWKPGDVAHDERLNNLASENTKTQASRVLCFKRVSRVTEEGHIQKWTQQRLPTSYCKRKSWLPWLEIKVRDKSNRETPTMLQGAIFPHPGQQRLPVLELEHHLRPLEILQLPPIL